MIAEASGSLGLGQQLQPFFLQALEIVGRSARLERSAAQQFRARSRHTLGRLHDLLFGFHRAGPGHHDEFVAADLAIVHADARALGSVLLAHELVGRGDADGLLHLRHGLYRLQARRGVADADRADHHALLTLDGVDLVAEIPDALTHLLDLLFRRVEFHRDDHGSISYKMKNPLFRVGCFYYNRYCLSQRHSPRFRR